MIVHIEPYQASLNAIEKRLTEMEKKDEMNNVLKKAVNEVAKYARERLYEETTERYTITSDVFKQRDIKKRADNKGQTPSAKITLKGPPVPVSIGYGIRVNSGKRAAGVRILRTSGIKDLEITSKGRVYKAFLSKTQYNHEGKWHYGIFQRVPGKYMKNSENREKIKEIYSLSRAKAAAVAFAESGLSKELQSELAYRMHKQMNAAIDGRQERRRRRK